MAQQVINNGESGLTVRGKLNSNFTELYATAANPYPRVANFAALPAPASATGLIYVVETSTGIWPVRRSAGMWLSNGAAWSWLGNEALVAEQITLTPIGGIAATNVQAAVQELDTEKAPLAGPTFTGLVTTGEVAMAGQLMGGLGSMSTAGVLDWNDITNARSGSGETLLRGTTASNGPVTHLGFHYPLSLEHIQKDGTGNLTQLAIPYNDQASVQTSPYFRMRISGVWSTWRKILSQTIDGTYRDDAGNLFWNAGNDGAGSGLDADLLDGLQATAFAATAHTHTSSEITDFSESVDDRVAAFLVPGSGISLTYNDAANTLTVASSAGVTDGDKGDITVSGTGTVWVVDNAAITLAKIQNASANSVLVGAGSAGTGAAYSQITLGANLTMTGTVLSASGAGGGFTYPQLQSFISLGN